MLSSGSLRRSTVPRGRQGTPGIRAGIGAWGVTGGHEAVVDLCLYV